MPSLFSALVFARMVLVQKKNLMVQTDAKNAPSSAERNDLIHLKKKQDDK